MKCLQKEPARRYAGADALADDLRRFGAGEPILARPVSGVERVWRWCRRKPALAALGIRLLCSSWSSPSAPLWPSYRSSRQREQARQAESEAIEKLWQSHLDRARANRLSGRAGQRFDSLESLAEAAKIRPTPELRDEAIACLALTDLRIVREWDGYPDLNTGVDFDARLERYARSDADGNISVRRVADDSEILRLPAPGPRSPAGRLVFSPDGRFLAATHIPTGGRERRHRVWDLPRDGLALDIADGPPGARLAFSPDGRRWRSVGPDHCHEHLRSRHVPGGEATGAGPGPGAQSHSTLSAGSWRSPARSIAWSRSETVTRGAIVATLPHPQGVRGLAWSGDGGTLAAGCDDHQIYLWDVATFRLRAVLKGHDAPVVLSPSTLRTTFWLGELGRDVPALGPCDRQAACQRAGPCPALQLRRRAAGLHPTPRRLASGKLAGSRFVSPAATQLGRRPRRERAAPRAISTWR